MKTLKYLLGDYWWVFIVAFISILINLNILGRLSSFEKNYLILYKTYNDLYSECENNRINFEKEKYRLFERYMIEIDKDYFEFVDDYQEAEYYIEPYGEHNDEYVLNYVRKYAN